MEVAGHWLHIQSRHNRLVLVNKFSHHVLNNFIPANKEIIQCREYVIRTYTGCARDVDGLWSVSTWADTSRAQPVHGCVRMSFHMGIMYAPIFYFISRYFKVLLGVFKSVLFILVWLCFVLSDFFLCKLRMYQYFSTINILILVMYNRQWQHFKISYFS